MFHSKNLFNLIILILIFSHVSCAATKDFNEKRKKITETLLFFVGKYHPKEVKIDDDFSQEINLKFIENLDNTKQVFLKKDLDFFARYKNKYDNYLLKMDLQFMDDIRKFYQEKIKRSKKIVKNLLKNKEQFTLTNQGFFINNTEEIPFVNNLKELRQRWKDSIQARLLASVYAKVSTSTNKNQIKQPSKKMIDESLDNIKKNYIEYFKRIEQQKPLDFYSLFINTVLSLYDPHTVYLTPKERDNFNINFSGQLEGIGARLQRINGETKVVSIVVGSASWRQKELKEGDVILKVAQKNKEPVDISDMNLDDSVLLIRGKKGTTVKLTVRKIDGSIKVIPIKRDIVVLEESFVKGALLNTGQKKIGYIYLPQFYAPAGAKLKRTSSADVKNELIRLKKNRAEALIFDLRNNGGGSLEDVREIVGMFIKTGPVVQVKDKLNDLQVKADLNPEIVWNKPLIVMVNKQSASASEIFAAAIQDYKRGIIVGSKHTFGKGTVQQLAPLDRFNSAYGTVKITLQKFYRINGGATQNKGVLSDIVLPSIYQDIGIGERELDKALPWDEISKDDYEQWNKPLKIKQLKAKSKNRVENSKIFSLVSQYSSELKKMSEDSEIPLDYNQFITKQKERSEINKNINKKLTHKSSFTISENYYQAKGGSAEEKKANLEKIKKWYDELLQDIHLEESLYILEDLQKARQ